MKKQVEEQIWQEEPNAIWYINTKPQCALCGKVVNVVLEYQVSATSIPVRACFDLDEHCFKKAMEQLFISNPEVDSLQTRKLIYKELHR
ncbi:MAG: hypothetical protein WC780_05345 [Lentimicrobiaceae bacterium]|jgi:hypothetical protein